jgi:RNA polymerase sigma factor (sigma-70 family)
MLLKEQDDMILIQNILDGNQTAQEILYKRYRKIVKKHILTKYSTYYDIDDDVSEILIKVFMNIKDFSIHKSKFKSWVFTITQNYLIDKWRCNNTCNTTILPANASLVSNNPGTFYNNNYSLSSVDTVNSNYNITNSASCNFENINAVNYICSQLSPSDFTLLDMKYVQGYDYNEIGKEFQLTSSTVSNKINYIKTKLKKNIPEDVFK